MCRTGGRRCETHWTKAQKDADNARRRAAYSAKKNQATISEPATSNTFSSEYGPEYGYLDYGFTKPSSLDNYKISRDSTETIAAALSESNDEDMLPLTYRERAALSVFASRSYQTINRYLHDSPTAEPLQKEGITDRFDHQISCDEDYLRRSNDNDSAEEVNASIAYTSSDFYYHQVISANNLQDYVATVDDAFKKAPGTERTLYRGESFGHDHHEGTLEEYVNSRMNIGSKIAFKGLQSTSLNAKTAKSFGQVGRGDGIVYEIKSPSGVNIAGVSSFPEESEVLLPRNTQYRVVGVHYLTGETKYTKEPITTAVVQIVEVDDNDNVRTKDNLRTEFGKFDAHKFVKEEGK